MLILGLLGMYFECCGGICHQVLTFFQIGCGHTVIGHLFFGDLSQKKKLSEIKPPLIIYRSKFDGYYIGQIYGGDFAKICGLLRIHELYPFHCPSHQPHAQKERIYFVLVFRKSL